MYSIHVICLFILLMVSIIFIYLVSNKSNHNLHPIYLIHPPFFAFPPGGSPHEIDRTLISTSFVKIGESSESHYHLAGSFLFLSPGKMVQFDEHIYVVVSNLFIFTPNLGKWSNLTCAYFWGWVVQPPTRIVRYKKIPGCQMLAYLSLMWRLMSGKEETLIYISLPGPSSRGAVLKPFSGWWNWHPEQRNHVRQPRLEGADKWVFPQIIHFKRAFHHKPSILGYHYFWKRPYISNGLTQPTNIQEQALGVSPAAHFWPSVSQVQALVGEDGGGWEGKHLGLVRCHILNMLHGTGIVILPPIIREVENGMPPIGSFPFISSKFPLNHDCGRKGTHIWGIFFMVI